MRLIIAALLAALAGQVGAQDWPQRPMRMLVGFGAGGGTDILARIVAPAMGAALGQPVVIENRPGAGGTIAAGQVAKAAPDGYTAFMLNNGHAVSAVMISPLPYDPVTDFEPVSMVATMPLVILAGRSAGFGSLQGLIDVARHNPGKLNLASVGIGSTQHFAAELLFSTAGIKLVHVPYKGTPNAVAATVANETQLILETLGSVIGQIRGGALNALAVTSATRFPGLPNVPTVAEAGLPGYDVTTWYALVFPARTPAAIVEKTRAALAAALAREDVQKQMHNAAFLPSQSTPAELAAHLKSEISRWGAVRDRAGIK
ncbi:MAG TPA: tripartite tricarboxylate transporter substrate binding protein [Burkholderiales bacterium]|jgi:tripartite-type tricarboxylate transporter receptor subunit TctC|nr:tripartite tricarboxylate transporter substrate binding protein [Burkholderiales bacterium]